MIPGPSYRPLKQRAAAGRHTVSSLVAELLEAGLRTRAAGQCGAALPPLPSFDLV